MTTALQPYLFFNGRCEEAINYYKSALGAEVVLLLRFSESPDPLPPEMIPPRWETKIMHGELSIGQTRVFVSDGCDSNGGFDGFALSLSVATEGEVDSLFNSLAAEGNITMPLGKTFWSPHFGMLQDRFGLSWMIGVEVNT